MLRGPAGPLERSLAARSSRSVLGCRGENSSRPRCLERNRPDLDVGALHFAIFFNVDDESCYNAGGKGKSDSPKEKERAWKEGDWECPDCKSHVRSLRCGENWVDFGKWWIFCMVGLRFFEMQFEIVALHISV